MVEIKNRFTGDLIYQSATAETTAQAVVELIQKDREADSDANLSAADLSAGPT